MDKKKLKSYLTRIRKAKNSFSVMGDVMLSIEFDNMELSHLLEIKALISYSELDRAIKNKTK
jgi:hypothetical protein